MSQIDDILKPSTDKPERPTDVRQPDQHMEESYCNGTLPPAPVIKTTVGPWISK